VQLQDTIEVLGLQGVKIKGIAYEEEESRVIFKVEPVDGKQSCPCCRSHQVIRNGKDGYRRIRHLDIAGKECLIEAPRIRLKCKSCEATYAYQYEFVRGKQQYTKAYKAHLYELAIGSTVNHASEIARMPYSSVERFFKEVVLDLCPKTKEQAQSQALMDTKLVLGIDDFAIRKGHNYNTGIHDLRGESLLDVVEGRTLSELCDYMGKNPAMAALAPYAVVMDLAVGYHSFAAKFFPKALRVADRFHVNCYILEAMNKIRRRIGRQLTPPKRSRLNRGKHLLNKRGSCLADGQRYQLQTLLSYSPDLKAAYEIKERLVDWYDTSISFSCAKAGFQRWLDLAHSFHIVEIEEAIKTFENWQTEIVNYHLCRFTNAAVEGRNGKIKSLQRRRFFVRNRIFYTSLIILECNKEISCRCFRSLFA